MRKKAFIVSSQFSWIDRHGECEVSKEEFSSLTAIDEIVIRSIETENYMLFNDRYVLHRKFEVSFYNCEHDILILFKCKM